MTHTSAAEQRARAICEGVENDRAMGMADAGRFVESDTVAELLAIIDRLRGGES